MAKRYVVEETSYVKLPILSIVKRHVLTEDEIKELKDCDSWAEPEDCDPREFVWDDFKDDEVIEGAELLGYEFDDIVDVEVDYYSEEVLNDTSAIG